MWRARRGWMKRELPLEALSFDAVGVVIVSVRGVRAGDGEDAGRVAARQVVEGDHALVTGASDSVRAPRPVDTAVDRQLRLVIPRLGLRVDPGALRLRAAAAELRRARVDIAELR